MRCARCERPSTQHHVSFHMEIPRGNSLTKGTPEAHAVSLAAHLCDHHAEMVYRKLKAILSRKPFEVIRRADARPAPRTSEAI